VTGNGETNTVGLCTSCKNAPTCCLRKKRGFDAVFCEMFEASNDPKNNDDQVKTEEIPVAVKKATRFKGLCINCANNETCTLVKPDEGVWHCEEYC